ncbi:glycerate kinase [Hydrogenophaga sp. A37]|uniref:glycerate kinase n=1 Tax=Hydrogenophaga sp. A37 TaxID=1945864 RepID=UPI00098472E7|nr:glycerate kinase [Hydrogenophaga sp. A37]OOG85891.1 glycerate kinase [Hydrogenophaga sp. A37]
MNFQRFVIPLAGAALLVLAHQKYGWPGVAVVTGGLVMWLLLHVTRLMTVFKRASSRPIGHVDSAVMLNAKLKPGVTLMHVLAMTRSLGERLTPEGEDPEQFRWTDGSDSSVTASFRGGRLREWTLQRPGADAGTPP